MALSTQHSKLSKDRLVILPAAGYGTRVGAPVAKELLPRPMGVEGEGQRMIEWALQVAGSAGAAAHVITRAEKTPLVEYLRGREGVETQLVLPTREWPETILLSKPYWREWNVVVLPDTDFAPTSAVAEIFDWLRGNDSRSACSCVFATFEADDYRTWGVVERALTEKIAAARHCEKPREWSESTRAWGVFGFHRDAGQMLLEQMLKSTFDHEWRTLPANTGFVALKRFRDLTRGG